MERWGARDRGVGDGDGDGSLNLMGSSCAIIDRIKRGTPHSSPSTTFEQCRNLPYMFVGTASVHLKKKENKKMCAWQNHLLTSNVREKNRAVSGSPPTLNKNHTARATERQKSYKWDTSSYKSREQKKANAHTHKQPHAHTDTVAHSIPASLP